LPAHHGQLGARLRLPLRRLCPGLGKVQQLVAGQQGGRRGPALQQASPIEIKSTHGALSSVVALFGRLIRLVWRYRRATAQSRLPVSLSNRCAAFGRGARRIFSPGDTAWRSRNTAITSWLPTRATIWVSEPVGSTTTTSASTPSLASSRC